MTSEIPSKPTKLCPTCGTRVSEDASRCLVCGSDLSGTEKSEGKTRAVQGSRMPQITLSLPIALILLALFLGIGAVLVYFALQETGRVVEPTVTPTQTATVTVTIAVTGGCPDRRRRARCATHGARVPGCVIARPIKATPARPSKATRLRLIPRWFGQRMTAVFRDPPITEDP